MWVGVCSCVYTYTQLMVSESDLRVQLNVYATKFEQFQEALNTSNDMFSQFKKKLDEMTKTTRR